MAQFCIKDLSFSYPTSKAQNLNNVNLSIEKGDYVVLCGKSGSGKTTLLRHLKTVLSPAGQRSGAILFEGRALEELSLKEQSSKIGYVMQSPDDQIVTDKVWHELAFGLENLGYDQKTMRLRVAEMASYFGIADWFNRNISELSGGQKQLLSLASIMAMQPEVLILDEPTSQLDPIAASDFLNTVKKINRELGTTIIITEHRLEDIYYAADKVIVMEQGSVSAEGTPRQVGELLYAGKSQMFAALPTPVRVFYETGASGTCPLTVRDGRSWLCKTFQNRKLKVCSPREDSEISKSFESALRFKDVWFRYEKDSPDILRGLDFDVPVASLFAIVGGNGAGKSTALKCACGICRPYRGSVEIFGKNLKKLKNSELFKGTLTMLPQDPKSLFVKQSIREDLEEMCSDGDKIAEIAQLCCISHLLDSHPYDLSGGEQQRSALAKVLLTDPKILLLDEPTKALDSFFKLSLADILKKLKERGITIVMVSHDVEFCAEHADLVSMFFDGQIVSTNTPQRFFGSNSFYTTAANRMSRCVFTNAVNAANVVQLYKANMEE